MDPASLSLDLTPRGHLVVSHQADAAPLDIRLAERMAASFERGTGHGLLLLGAGEAGTSLPPVHAYWREFGARFITSLCVQDDSDAPQREVRVAPPPGDELERIALAAPPMMGAEYLTATVLRNLWEELNAAFALELSESKCGVQDFLKRRNPAWNLVGRVHFNLAENRKDPDSPFAFLATYTTRLNTNSSGQTKAQHLPLGQALSEYAGAANKHRLLSLLVPVQRASEACPWLKAMVAAGEIVHPLRWTPQEALQVLRDVPQLEAAGVVVRMPAAWRGNRPPRPRVSGTVGAKAPSGLGQKALLDFQMEVTLDGEQLTSAEISALLGHSDGLALVRGRWIEVNREHLRSMIERFDQVERAAIENGLSFSEAMRRQAGAKPQPSLLVAPASLLANWVAEMERFTPGLRALVAHPSALPAAELKAFAKEPLQDVDLVITSYGSLLRAPWITEVSWRLAVLDEAQAIKNPDAKQTRAVKKLKAGARLALTGTPVENRLGDLWSIFDFVNPGLLGSSKEFTSFAKRLAKQPHGSFLPLRELVRPYILRRLKTDKTVIADLPDKTEIKAFCPLSRLQAALYEQAVKELSEQLADATGIRRKGLVLSFLMRFKQICNHPSQWLGDGAWAASESGKWARLRDIAEIVAAKQEKMLVFTQFREVTAPLAAFLGSVFERPGLVLHGETAVKNRQALVRRFQEDESVGFFVLSLKAGGAGLNLTAASHVVHFDRWWNPAVENQATDRAFRIGQTKNVLVHKFVCRGTVEEKIDELIESKRQLSRDVLEGGADVLLTELKDDELLKLVALDINKAIGER